MYYIFNQNGDCICACEYKPNSADLKSRNETAAESEHVYDISKARLKDGKVAVVAETLDELKASKLEEINYWTESKIVRGFSSNASGESVKYDSDRDSQLTVQGAALNADSAVFAGKYPNGYPLRGTKTGSSAKVVQHLSAEQLMLLCSDLSAHITACKQAGWEKQSEVEAATSEEDLSRIILD